MIVFVEIIPILRIYNAILFSHQLPDAGNLEISEKMIPLTDVVVQHLALLQSLRSNNYVVIL
jgi:hypothetical protein